MHLTKSLAFLRNELGRKRNLSVSYFELKIGFQLPKNLALNFRCRNKTFIDLYIEA